MLECMYDGCHSEGFLPGGLSVRRRAFDIHSKLLGTATYNDPKEWIREYKDVLKTPKWKFVDRLVIGNVQYIHGEAGTARTKCRADMMSTVQGHLHTQAYTEWYVGANYKVFGTQVGCGINHDSYAMAYAKRGKKPAIGCAVILNEEQPINIMMKL